MIVEIFFTELGLVIFFNLDFSRKNLGILCFIFFLYFIIIVSIVIGDLIYFYFNWY